jgi:hypothetical protein
VHASSDPDRPCSVHEPTQPDQTIASGDLGHEGNASAREDALDSPVGTHLVAMAVDRGIEGADHLHGGVLVVGEVATRVQESRPFESVNGDPGASNVACVFGVGALSGVVTDHDRASRDQRLGASPKSEEVFDLEHFATARASEGPAHEHDGRALRRAVTALVIVGSVLMSFVPA